jgi:beta-N-acetylhexosaminidase
MDMGGLTEHFDAGEAAVRAIEAGEDQIMFSANTDAAIDAVKAAVASGRLTRERIDESVRRILAAKALVSHQVADPDEIFRVVDSESTRALAAEIAEKAITLVREESGTLPLKKSAHVALLVITDFAEAVNPVAGLKGALRERLTAPPRMFRIDARSTSDDVAPAALACRESDVVIVALAVRARAGAGRLAVPRAAKHVLDQMRGCPARIIAVSFGSPYVIRELPQLPTYLCAYGPAPVLSIAAARALFGETPIGGRLPITIPGMYARGHGILRQSG